MKEEMFEEPVESVRQAGAIMRGEMEPSRVLEVETLDVKSIRASLGIFKRSLLHYLAST